jgi:hypothetical protein
MKNRYLVKTKKMQPVSDSLSIELSSVLVGITSENSLTAAQLKQELSKKVAGKELSKKVAGKDTFAAEKLLCGGTELNDSDAVTTGIFDGTLSYEMVVQGGQSPHYGAHFSPAALMSKMGKAAAPAHPLPANVESFLNRKRVVR